MADMTIDLIEVDDWCCLYINGEAAYQGHSMTASQLLRELDSRKGMLEEWSVTQTFYDYDKPVPGMGLPGEDWGQFPEEMPDELREALDA